MKRLFLAVLILVPWEIGQAQTPETSSVVRVKLILVDNKTTLRMGEPIRLAMEFTSDLSCYSVDTLPDPGNLKPDTISVTPASSVNHWYDEMTRGYQYMRDLLSSQRISATPTRLPITLNDTLRFDQPGRYTVKITTQRVDGPVLATGILPAGGRLKSERLVLTTNEVTFDVVTMSEEEEQAEVKRISALLDAKRDVPPDDSVSKQLAFLTGDPSTREKVRRFLNSSNRDGIYVGNIHLGLYIARNRKLVLKLLENGMRDINQPVDDSLIRAVSTLYYLQDQRGVPYPKVRYDGWLTAESDSRFAAIQNSYLAELALSLNRRKGQRLSTTALTILTMAQKGTASRTLLVGEVRRVLVRQFSSLDRDTQDLLLQKHWDDIRDPELLGPLKLILSDNSDSARSLHQQALSRLIDAWPNDARQFVIDQICDDHSNIKPEILARLSDKSLWEVDRCLVGQMHRLQGMIDASWRMVLERKAPLLARYATKDDYGEIIWTYRESGSDFPPEVAAALLAYLAKQNEAETIPLIEQRLEKIKPNDEDNFLPKLTKLYYSDGLGKILKQRLNLDEPYAVSTAAYLLGKYGSPGDEAAILARLTKWQNVWKGRVAEAHSNFQGIAERDLVDALINSKAFGLTPERKQELRRNCLTEHCKQSNPYLLPER